jgi:hypothetical protein
MNHMVRVITMREREKMKSQTPVLGCFFGRLWSGNAENSTTSNNRCSREFFMSYSCTARRAAVKAYFASEFIYSEHQK